MGNKIYVYKIVTGEEIIAESPTDLSVDLQYELFNPVQLIVLGKDNMGFVPFMPHCDTSKGIQLGSKKVVFRLELNEDMANEYKRHFNKVITPTTKILI